MDSISTDSTLGHSLARWVAWTTVAMFLGVGAAVLAVTRQPADAAIVGGFAAAWGGPAFGAMFGAGSHAIRADDLAKQRGEIGANHAPIGAPGLVGD